MKRLSFVLLFLIAIVGLAPQASAQGGPMPVCSMNATPGVIQKGGTVNLKWETQNAVAGTITSIGSVGANGTQGVIPTKTTEYVGIFTGAEGSVRCAVTVIVTLPEGGTTQPSAPPAAAQPTPSQQSTPLPQSPNATPGSNISIGDPLGGKGLVPCNGLDCQACHVAQLVQRIINFLILLSVPIAAILIAVAGAMLFSSGAIDTKAKAKAVLKNALVGFLIAITSWLVINTILNILLDPAYKQGGSWFSIQCVAQSTRPMSGSINDFIRGILGDVPPPTSINSGTGGGGGASAPTIYCDEEGMCFSDGKPYTPGSGATVANPTLTEGISVKPGANINGVQATTLQYINGVPSLCNCDIVITEGTGGTHAQGTFSHGNGYKLDIRSQGNTQLYNYVTSNGAVGSWSNGTPTWTIGSATWALEGQGTANEHWDVVVPVR